MDFTYGDKVRATESIGTINPGDTGIVIAGWVKAKILVRWNKDGQPRTINRKRLEKV